MISKFSKLFGYDELLDELLALVSLYRQQQDGLFDNRFVTEGVSNSTHHHHPIDDTADP